MRLVFTKNLCQSIFLLQEEKKETRIRPISVFKKKAHQNKDKLEVPMNATERKKSTLHEWRKAIGIYLSHEKKKTIGTS